MEASIDRLIPPALREQVEALAAAERRPAGDIVREAIEDFLHLRGPKLQSSTLTPQEAGALIRELRKGNVLPEGETIEDLIDFGRA